MNLITVSEAENSIQSEVRDFGTEKISYEKALGRILAENLYADRDLPPFDRATVDGIAVQFSDIEFGNLNFKIVGIQAAGKASIPIQHNECVEIMTGCPIDKTADSVIRYEDISIENGMAKINIDVKKGQNIHAKGKDKLKGEILVPENQIITSAILGIAASIGKTEILVKKLPKILIISTGDEMISPNETPTDFQLRRSNGITVKSALEKFKINADLLHLNDDENTLRTQLSEVLNDYDVLLLTGGVSMGKFDFIPKILEELGVQKKFHKIKQRPGKPFWFGTFQQKTVFAFPGNPVSVFMCLHRYFIPWLEQSLGLELSNPKTAILENDVKFSVSLQYFAQVKTQINNEGMLTAKTFDTNGSGDFSHLAEANAFMEFPLEKDEFKAGEKYPIWFFNSNF